MIRVTAERGRLTLEGHAGYAPTGKDIVCAAVSALVLALAERLQEKNLVRELIMRPGYVRIAMRGADREHGISEMRAAAAGETVPQCVEVIENRLRIKSLAEFGGTQQTTNPFVGKFQRNFPTGSRGPFLPAGSDDTGRGLPRKG